MRKKTDRAFFPPGTHPFGDHVWILIRQGLDCQTHNTRPEHTRPMVIALGQAMDMVGAGIAAVRPRAASAEVTPTGHRDRWKAGTKPDPEKILPLPLPMNPTAGHHGGGKSDPPSAQLDSDFFRREHDRIDTHWDRCEVVRRAARHLAGLIRRDPDEEDAAITRALPPKNGQPRKEPTLDEQVLEEGRGHPIDAVARHFQITIRQVAAIRNAAKPKAQHPLRGLPWTPPQENAFAAEEARAMKAAGLTSTDIGAALGRGAAAVRNWTSERRRRAA